MNYRDDVLRTANRIPSEEQLLCSAFGLCGESGEVADLIKKSFFHHHPFEKNNILLELGDVTWYLELACLSLNIELPKKEPTLENFKVDQNILMRLSLKLCRKAGWFADHISDHKFDGKGLDYAELTKRLEDIQSCLSYFAIALSTSLDEIKEKNIEKLKLRYPEGFSSESSINRNNSK